MRPRRRQGSFDIDTRTLVAYGLSVLLGLVIAASLAYFRYNSSSHKRRRSRAISQKRNEGRKEDRLQARIDDDV